MFRFIMPDAAVHSKELLHLLKAQCDAFLHSDALRELFSLLRVDEYTIHDRFNGRRRPDGSIRETQEMESSAELEPLRIPLYALLRKLGFFDIDQPLCSDPDHILILGASLNSCYAYTQAAVKWIGPHTRSINGLSCYRPINPAERSRSRFDSQSETEFGALSDAFSVFFGLDLSAREDDFQGDRNLNRISCVRTLRSPSPSRSSEPHATDRTFRIFAAPSSEPERRRADTGDTLTFYLQNTDPHPGDTLLAVTHNRYCNRQFLQLAYHLLTRPEANTRIPLKLDVTGCLSGDHIFTEDTYDPYQYLQDLIAILDWIERFKQIRAL